MNRIKNLIIDISLFFLKRKPRYREGYFSIYNKKIKYSDPASFAFMYEEIFINKVYDFISTNERPIIIDCGANIGLSIIFFKKLFPKSKIIAFEADPKIYSILKQNIDCFNYENVSLIQKALWNEQTKISFYSEGADAGRIINDSNCIKIETDLLSGYLNDKIDLLKIDIEGAELNVLFEASNKLCNVKNIFIEFHSFTENAQVLDEILSILKKSGFRYYINSPGLTSQNPFKSINTYLNMDMQLNIYAIRGE